MEPTANHDQMFRYTGLATLMRTNGANDRLEVRVNCGQARIQWPHFMEGNMKPVFLSALLLALVSGCAENMKSHSVPTEPTTKNLDECHLSVKFSGQPDLMPDSMASEFSNMVDVRGGTHWMYLADIGGVRSLEFASCICPSATWLDNLKMSTINNRRFVNGVGMVSEAPVENLFNGMKMAGQTIISSETDCVVLQTFTLKGAPDSFRVSADKFFSSIKPIIKPVQNSSNSGNKASAIERLRQLELLLKEKLITPDEFNNRRATILQTL